MTSSRLLPVSLAVLALSGCAAFGSGDSTPTATGTAAPGTATPGTASGPATVLTGVYPLQYLVEEIGGDRVAASSLTPPTVDPHTVELSPRTVADMAGAALVVHLSGFQTAVDDAIDVTGAHAFDAAEHTELLTTEQTGHDHADDDGHDDEAHDEAADEAAGGTVDPHFWLDPVRLAEVGTALAEELGRIDPDGAASYTANAERLAGELTRLEEDLATGLASCARDTIVVAHEAYGYLTHEHALQQEGLSGIDPEAEPSPARLAEIADVVAEHDVDTVFVESLLSPAVSEALARDLGLRTAVLDPLESQQDESADYLDVMRANLAALQEALGCR